MTIGLRSESNYGHVGDYNQQMAAKPCSLLLFAHAVYLSGVLIRKLKCPIQYWPRAFTNFDRSANSVFYVAAYNTLGYINAHCFELKNVQANKNVTPHLFDFDATAPFDFSTCWYNRHAASYPKQT